MQQQPAPWLPNAYDARTTPDRGAQVIASMIGAAIGFAVGLVPFALTWLFLLFVVANLLFGDAGWHGTNAQRQDIRSYEDALALLSAAVLAAMVVMGALTGRAIVTRRWRACGIVGSIAGALVVALVVVYCLLRARHPEL